MAVADYFDTVQKVYIAFYQRPADPAGLVYWANKLDAAKGSLAEIIDSFANSAEASALYGEINADTIGAVIDAIYAAAFNRAPDAAGKQWYIDAFNAGEITAGAIAVAVLDGAQNDDAAAVANKLAVANLFTAAVDGRALTDAAFGTAPFVATYSGNADADAARGILAPVGADAASVLTAEQIQQAIIEKIADAGDSIIPPVGQTFTLTTGVDTPVLSANNDTITGVVSALTAENTLNTTDVIDGLEGVDTLKVDLKSNFTGFTTAGKLANVENIELTNSGTIGRNFDATGVTGAQKYVLNAGESSISLSNLAAAGIAVDVVGQKSGTATVGFTTKAVEGTADALTVGVNGVGTAEVKDASGTVTSAAKYVTVTATGIENLTVNATGANLVNLAGAATKTITAAGEGSLNVEAVGTVTSFDASGVKGAVTANLTGAAAGTLATVKGGEGNDVFTVALGDLTATAAISGGAGTNTLKVSGSGTVQPTMSQFQTLELNGVDGATIVSGKNISDLATLLIKGAGIAANTVTVSGLPTSALAVTAEGAQGAGTVTLTAPTVLTYNTQSTAANTTAKTQENVQTIISAGEATNATINVGAYTKQTGDITVNKATAVTLNVASGKDAAGTTEQTAFDAELTANAAQSVIVKADGVLGVAANKTITAGAATLLDVTATGGGDMEFATVKAQQVNITAGAALDIQGSTLTAAEQVTIAANVGHTNGTGVNLGKISTLNLSGTGTATGKEAQVTLGNLGAADITNAITVTATGLKGGATIGTIDTNAANVTITATEMTGNFVATNIGATKNVGNVTINAATLGSTDVGTISTVKGATVQVNATGLLGKNAAGEALAVGNTKVDVDTNKNTGAITVNVSGSNKLDIGTLQAKTVTVDASGYLGGNIATTGENGTLGKITGQTVTVKGTELGTNKFTIDAQQHVDETTAAVSVTGGLQNDVLTISNTSAFVSTEAYTISFNGGDGTADEIVFAGTVSDLTNAGSKLTLTNVEKLTATESVTVKAADVTGLTLTVAPATGKTFTVKGTDAADTIDLSKITGALTVQAGKGADTIKLKADNSTIDTVKYEATAADNGADAITGFEGGSGKDILDFTGFLGGSSATTLVTASADPGTATPVVAADKSIVILTDIANGQDISTASGLAAALTTGGEYVNINATSAGTTKYVFLTAASATATTYNVFYADSVASSTEFSNITLVGTVATDSVYTALHDDNFA